MSTNRKIKFRAWDNKKKEMLIQNDFMSYHVFNLTPDGLYYKEGKLQDIDLMEHTGFNDYNKEVELYEGDLVKVLNHYEGDTWVEEFIGEIVMNEGSWWIEYDKGFGVSVWEYCYNYCGGLQGNIYEKKGGQHE